MANAIITGGSAGLSRALAAELLRAGFTVTITARTEDSLITAAAELGGSAQPALRELDRAAFERILAVNVIAPLELINQARPRLASGAMIINISSDAAVGHYEGWGGYGASKAALEHLTLTLAAEEPDRRWYAVDPGDLRTAMHQAAFPGEDISDRPLPETITPAFLELIRDRPESGRCRAADLIGAAR